jgi:HEPN domain-containing protein
MNETDVKEWQILAGHDADTAALLIKEKGHADIIIYHVNQAIEKLLKALLAKAGKPAEKTHFLDKLLSQLLADYPGLADIQDDILEINLFQPKLRYPSGERIEFKEALSVHNKFLRISKILNSLV